MHKPHGGKSGKREKKFLRQLEKILVILSLRKPLFKKTLIFTSIYMKFSGFPTKGAKETREWGWGRLEDSKQKKKCWEGRGNQEAYIFLNLEIPAFFITVSYINLP